MGEEKRPVSQEAVKAALAKNGRPSFVNLTTVRADSQSLVRIDGLYFSQDDGALENVATPLLMTQEHARDFAQSILRHLEERLRMVVARGPEGQC